MYLFKKTCFVEYRLFGLKRTKKAKAAECSTALTIAGKKESTFFILK